MSTERKFKQAVCMRINREQYEADIKKWAQEVIFPYSRDDYRPKRFEEYPFLAANISTASLMLCFDENLIGNPYRIEDYNPDLFKAIAAMSEGDEFYPGEWVVYNGELPPRLVKFIEFIEPGLSGDIKMNVLDEKETQWQWVENYRKATLEELVAQFQQEKDKLSGLHGYYGSQEEKDQIEKIGDAVPYLGVLYRNVTSKKLYDVLHLADDITKGFPAVPSVVYKSRDNGKVYVKTLDSFSKSYKEVFEATQDQLIAAYAEVHKMKSDQVIVKEIES